MGAGFNSAVESLAIHNGSLYAGGYFASSGGATTLGIAKWDGVAWQPLESGLVGQDVRALVSFDNKLYAGGLIGLAAGQASSMIARWGCVCFANCDNSGISPILNVNDFQCFLNAFAAGDPYANCDGSTIPPVLNVNDFQCYLNKFAAGCP